MNHYFQVLVLVGLGAQPFLSANPLDTKLSVPEEQELNERIEKFYLPSNGKSMIDTHVPKFDPRTSAKIDPNAVLKGSATAKDPLLRSAGRKVSPKFQKARDKEMIKRRFPFHGQSEKKFWEGFQPHDRVEDLVNTWVAPADLVRNLDSVPSRGEAAKAVWSGDYWRTRFGQTSYRYSDGKYFSSYKEAVESYLQPAEWHALRENESADKITETIAKWSPSEKYDLLVGSESLELTKHQKLEGSLALGEDGDVESWFGICHGWAPASFMVPVPSKTFSTVGVKKANITWYPDDVKAMATLAWANGRYATNFMGGRCNSKDVERFENGRLSQAECFDNNPASFHLAVGNMLGIQSSPLIMDATFDYQVWNQPILSYEFTYFNPLSPKKKGKDWKKFAVTYDDKFKGRDRFQKPLTRGDRSPAGTYDDSAVSKIVGVTATIVYLIESGASSGEEPGAPSTARVTYSYDLELKDQEGVLVASGGEWHENAHPDFLWVPQKEAQAAFPHDREKLNVDLTKEPEPFTTQLAEHASGYGYPLCQILAPLVEASSGDASYRCRF